MTERKQGTPEWTAHTAAYLHLFHVYLYKMVHMQ